MAALIAAVLWLIASRAETPAPSETSGVGALIGGYLIGRNHKGDRIDLMETIKKQSTWNSRAALAATITAVFGFCAALAHLVGK